ncbi:MAG TPA: hypothetical protein VMH83_14600 [Candidatus Acidoferrum sp.]|nr:hypothetical protein [Candidatus Acidoferrum sp.]
MNKLKQGIAIAVVALSCVGVRAAEGPGTPPPPRPGLFFEEVWKQVPKGGENALTQSNVANANLELKMYGPKSDQLQVTGIDGNDTNPTHTWSGLCGAGCTFALKSKKSYADFSKGARIMVQSKTSGFHKIHPFIKLADGKTYIGDKELGQTADFLFEEFRLEQVKWIAFNTELGVTKGNLLNELDVSKVDEIGFTDLQPGADHGPGGWSDVGAIRVYANAVAR